ncbi:MAG TPA: ATP-binding cassette domain-containing protein [Actinomycetota bacterium]|nr:ATP-binding cassette domain-containing protein [Actinomycetota bacterium]
MTGAIEVEGLRKRFGDVVALDGIDFSVPPRSIFGLLGPNGAGKTTAVRILATVLEPDGGRAVVLGRDVVAEPDAVRRRIGLAGQFAAVDPNLTGRENLRLIGLLTQMETSAIPPRAAELLERFDLSDAADRPVRTYSGGMRRRLDVAAALVPHPPVLFLDEPTTGLDLHSRNGLWDMINELVEDGTTVLLTTQYLEEADRLAERVAVIDHGQVIANDAPSVLKAQLGSTVAELGFEDAFVAEQARALLAGRHPGVEREMNMVRLGSNEGPRLLVDVLRELDGAQLAPLTLAVHEPSLDDVFLSLTGRHAEEKSEADEGAPEGPGRGRRRRGAA